MEDGIQVEDWIIMLQGIVAVVISKWSFHSSFLRQGVADKCKLSIGSEAMFTAERIPSHLEFLPCEQRGEDELRHIFRQRGDCCDDQRRRPSEKDSHRQSLA